MKTKITIGICIYNQEHLVDKLLKSLSEQELDDIEIKEIICVADCPDQLTLKKIRKFKNLPIKLHINKKRQGKFGAINKILETTSTKFIVLVSADVYLEKDSIKNIIHPLIENKKIGIVASKICKEKKKGLVPYMVWLEWNALNNISELKPKYGEFIAFRNVIAKIPKTSVDEEEIATEIFKKGFTGTYSQAAICHNKSPETITDFIKQRRRIFTGHLFLKKRQNYSPPTLNNKIVLDNTIKLLKFSELHLFFITGVIEMYSRFLGYIDYLKNKEQIKWDISSSTKK